MRQRRVGILIFPEVEVLDFCGPFEVFATTRLDESRRREEPAPYEVVLIAESRDVVVASGGLKIVPDHTPEDCPSLDVLVVPGGWGTRREIANRRLLDWIARAARASKLWPRSAPARCCWARPGCSTGVGRRHTGRLCRG